jgi:hypothetical protein
MQNNTNALANEWFNSANSDFLYAEVGLKEDIQQAFEYAKIVKSSIDLLIHEPSP